MPFPVILLLHNDRAIDKVEAFIFSGYPIATVNMT